MNTWYFTSRNETETICFSFFESFFSSACVSLKFNTLFTVIQWLWNDWITHAYMYVEKTKVRVENRQCFKSVKSFVCSWSSSQCPKIEKKVSKKLSHHFCDFCYEFQELETRCLTWNKSYIHVNISPAEFFPSFSHVGVLWAIINGFLVTLGNLETKFCFSNSPQLVFYWLTLALSWTKRVKGKCSSKSNLHCRTPTIQNLCDFLENIQQSISGKDLQILLQNALTCCFFFERFLFRVVFVLLDFFSTVNHTWRHFLHISTSRKSDTRVLWSWSEEFYCLFSHVEFKLEGRTLRVTFA